ncbi:MAG TPA: YncE family protein, partial [Ktedonobacterales bacterium]|nr:YncE family protein [Ktedonobacterales bacterium]
MWRWMAEVNVRVVRRAHRFALAGLLTCVLALAACSGDSTTAHQTPAPNLPDIARPAQLAAYHIFVSDLADGDVAELGIHTYHDALSVHGLGLSTNGRWLYATDVADNQLLAYPFNGTALGVPGRVTIGALPVHMVNTLDGKLVFVTDFYGSSVTVVNTASWRVVKVIPTPPGPHGIVLTPDGRYAYVACFEGSK